MDKVSFRIFIVAILFSLSIVGVALYNTYKFPPKEKISVKYVTSANIFYTVERCVDKYVSLIVNDNSEALYNVIDNSYKKEKNITMENVLNYNISLDGNYSFVAQKMLEDNNSINTYYVSGYLLKSSEVDYEIDSDRINYSIIIKLHSNNTFTVIPDIEKVGAYFNEA